MHKTKYDMLVRNGKEQFVVVLSTKCLSGSGRDTFIVTVLGSWAITTQL